MNKFQTCRSYHSRSYQQNTKVLNELHVIRLLMHFIKATGPCKLYDMGNTLKKKVLIMKTNKCKDYSAYMRHRIKLAAAVVYKPELVDTISSICLCRLL